MPTEERRRYNKVYYQENKERVKAKVNKWRVQNAERERTNKQKYYEENKEKRRAYFKEWRLRNLESQRAHDRSHMRKLKNRERQRHYYYKKRGIKPGDFKHRVYEEAALKYLKESGLKPISNISVGNVECTETGTHRYPDALMWCKGFALIVEIDEHAHRGAAYECDFRRMAEICGCLSAPVWFVRYKPDAPESNLEELAEKVRSIQEQEEPEWKFLNFNVDYMFYNERDMMVARERMLAAKR
jgi:hypothetical protein